jgi:ATP-dependent DNA helicase RecG
MKITKKDLEIIAKEGEGYKAEFKEGPSNLDKEMVAFANASGGRIFIGITDHGNIKGVEITNRLKSQIQDIANNCRPKIPITFEVCDGVLVININEGKDKPYECSSGFYNRIGANSQKISRNEIISFLKSESKIRFDELIETKFDYRKDFDNSKFATFLKLSGLSASIKPKDAVVNLDAAQLQEGKLHFNNSGVLFFAKNPQKFISWSVFTVALFKDKVGVDIIDRKEITGSLFEIVEQVMDFVKLYSKVAYRFTGKPQRDEIYEYPFEAIREAVINSVMHKDYFERGHNNILKFFPDRIQIENIWCKPKNFILNKTIFRRNHIIADLLSRIHFGEKMGSGMKRIKDICKAQNAPNPKVDFTDTHFYVVFKQSYEYLKMAGANGLGEGREKSREKSREKILEIIRANPQVTISELAASTGLSVKGIEKNIRLLKLENLLKRIGPDKGGRWVVS